MRSNLMLFGAQKGKGPGTWPFPSSPIKSGCSSEAVSYRSEHKWAKEVQNCVGLHSAFTFTTPRAIHLQSCSLSFSPRSATSHQNSHSCPEPLGQHFPPDFSMLLFPWLCILQCYDRFLLGSNCPWCENYPLCPLLITPYFVAFGLH